MAGVVPGLLGGILMAAVLSFLSYAQQHSPFRPLLVIASTVVGAPAMSGGAGTVVLGLTIHFGVSALLGMLFVLLCGPTTMLRLLSLGLAFGVVLWALSQFVLLPLVNPLTATQPGLVWPFFLGTLAYGLLLGACSPTMKDIDTAATEVPS